MNKLFITAVAVALLVSGCGDKDDVVSGTAGTSGLDKAMESSKTAMSDLKAAAGSVADDAAKMASDAANAAGDATKGAIDKAGEMASSAKTMASDAVSSAGEMSGDAMDKAGAMASSAKTAVSDSAGAVKESATAAASKMTAAVSGESGQAVYQKNCQACHASGVAGSPKLGDKAAWAPRIATGIDAMVASVTNGKGVMPARGACASCSDADLKVAVEYMVNQSM